MAALERTDEWWWLGHAHAWTGLNLANTGAFEDAIGEASRMRAIGAARHDPRLVSYASWNIGFYESTRGVWERGIAECAESLRTSPDPLNSAYSMGWLGFGYREQGDFAQAVALLEESIRMLDEFRYGRLVAWFTGWLSLALLGTGDDEGAAERARAAVRLSRDVGYPWSSATALAAVGRVAFARGDVHEAIASLTEAVGDFTTMGCRHDAAVTRLALAEALHCEGDGERAHIEFAAALAALREGDAPIYRTRAEQLAERLDIVA